MVRARRCASALAEVAHHNTRFSHQQKPLPTNPSRPVSKELNPPWLPYPDTHRQPSTENGSHNHIQDLCKRGHLDCALEILSHMHIPPSPATYTSLLKACSRNKALPQAERVLQHIARLNIQLPSLICDYLVVTLAKCGNVDIACHIFVTLPHRTTFSWTAIISAHVDCGHAREAIEMHQCMQADGIEPDSFTFASLFKACGSVSDLEYGKKLHGESYKKGCDSDIFVNNTLVSMYGKCRAILEAENVFVRLTQHDVISWNAMLSIYLEQGQGRKALLLYRQMQEESVSPDKHTFVFTLQACGICMLDQEVRQQGQEFGVICLEIGQALHAEARKKGFALDVFVGTALIHMYGRCAAVLEVEGVFCALSERDIVAWNALLSIYIDQGQGSKSLQLYFHMQKQEVVPDRLTFMFAFQACGFLAETEEPHLVEGRTVKMSSLEIGKALHVDADRQGYTSGGFVGNTLLSMYVKCGGIAESEDAFCKFSQRDTVSWNVLLSAYIEQGRGEKSLKLYRQFKNEGALSDICVLISAVRACCALSELKETKGCSLKVVSLEIGQALHADARKEAFASDTFLNTTLLSMYSKCGAVEKAEYVIGSMLQLDTVSWNAMLSAYVEHGQGEKVLQAFEQMLKDSVCPDHLTFVCALQACGILAEKGGLNVQSPIKSFCLEIGEALHTDASKLGFASDALVGTALLSMYGKCGSIVKAKDVFWALSYRDTVSWNAMLSVLVEHSQVENALCLYRDMPKQGVIVNDVTFICVLHACSEAGSLEMCKQLHFCIVAAGYGGMGAISATLVHAYGNCASTEDAQMSFDTLSKSDFVSWTACVAGYASEGNILACFYIFENLKLEGLKPDEVMFASVLSACSRTGLVTECLELFVFMREYGLIPSLKHYGIMVELFGRAGVFERLKNLLGSMPVQADLTLWLCLLGACHTHGNLDLAKQAFDHASKIQSMQAAPYIMMANIFAEAGMLESATEMDDYRQSKGE